jgi:hypothetical protein
LLLGREFASRSCSLGTGDGSALIGRKRHWFAVNALTRQRQHCARDIVLLLGWELPNGFQSLFKQFGHA